MMSYGVRLAFLFLFLALFVAPVEAGPHILSDEELDQVTAQGAVVFNISPQIITNTVVVTPVNTNTIVITDTQTNTSAITNVCSICGPTLQATPVVTNQAPSLGVIAIIQPTIVGNTVIPTLVPTTFQIQF